MELFLVLGLPEAAQSPGTCSMFVCSKSPMAIASALTEHHAAAQRRSYDTVQPFASEAQKDTFNLAQGKWLGNEALPWGEPIPSANLNPTQLRPATRIDGLQAGRAVVLRWVCCPRVCQACSNERIDDVQQHLH